MQTTTVILPAAYFRQPGSHPCGWMRRLLARGKAIPIHPPFSLRHGRGAVTVTLNNPSHPFSKDFDIPFVGPSGQSVLMSDAGVLLTAGPDLYDAAELALSSQCRRDHSFGTYQPSNMDRAGPVSRPARHVHGNKLSVFAERIPPAVSLYVSMVDRRQRNDRRRLATGHHHGRSDCGWS
jgi:hypothetical protein